MPSLSFVHCFNCCFDSKVKWIHVSSTMTNGCKMSCWLGLSDGGICMKTPFCGHVCSKFNDSDSHPNYLCTILCAVCVALFLYWRFCTLLVVVLHKNCTRFHNVRSDHLNWASSGFVICVWSLALFMFIYPKTNGLSALACSRYEVHLILLRSAQPILQKQKLGHCTKLSYHFHKQNHAYFKRILDGNNVILFNVTLP